MITQVAEKNSNIHAEVKRTLALLTKVAPGKGIEVRIPPYAAVQCGDGPSHSRGTPPNVIEMQAEIWLSLANGSQSWSEAMAAGAIRASELAPISHVSALAR
ncbi:MAG: sterol carrier family protein [Actinomycetota bacterium]